MRVLRDKHHGDYRYATVEVTVRCDTFQFPIRNGSLASLRRARMTRSARSFASFVEPSGLYFKKEPGSHIGCLVFSCYFVLLLFWMNVPLKNCQWMLPTRVCVTQSLKLYRQQTEQVTVKQDFFCREQSR